MVRSCPACGEADFEATARFDRVPVQVNRLARTREEALASPCGPIDLVRCRHCGTSWNHRFDPALVHYDAGYDNPLDVSPVFRDWQTGAARDLVARHQLHGATVLEVGCGRAGFLRAVLAAGAGRGLAYEPAWDPAWPVPPGCEIRSSAFQSVGADDRRADLVILRHVLEHLEEPLALLQLLRQLGCPILVEVPDGATLMEPGGCWDLIYEHVSYFEASGMSRLLERAGFAVDRIGREFGDQFLVVDARSSEGDQAPPGPASVSAGRPVPVTAELEQVRERLRNGRWVIWGAGSKGMTLLNMLGDAAAALAITDVNPEKWGRHVPGTGHRVLEPGELQARPPDGILVMNPQYRAEIGASAARLGLSAVVACAGEAA